VSGAAVSGPAVSDAESSTRAVPYVCPFCGEEDLRPVEQGRWHCRSCLRVFGLTFHGLLRTTPPGSSTHGSSTHGSSTHRGDS